MYICIRICFAKTKIYPRKGSDKRNLRCVWRNTYPPEIRFSFCIPVLKRYQAGQPGIK